MRTIYLIFIFFSTLSLWSQESIKTTYIDSLVIDANQYIGKDNFKVDYFVNSNTLIKNNSLKKFQYKNVSLGKIERVCITNPLQLVVFYEDFNSLILLDNQLNETQKIEGNSFDIPLKIEAFGLASQNQVWLYDGFLQKISLYNFKTNFNKIISTPLNSKIKDYSSDYNYFYWVDESNTLFSISLFGNIKNLGKIPAYDYIQLIDASKIIYSKGNELFYLNTNSASEQKIDLIVKSFDNFFYSTGILSIFTLNHITNYKIDLP